MAIRPILSHLLSIWCLLPVVSQAREQPREERPNIIIIFTDDQGYQDVGAFGSPDIQTPHLDRMAAEGVRFTNFHVAQAVCSASRAALLTGSYPNRVGIHGALDHTAKHGLNPNEITIAEVVKPLGYRTAAIGKWHLGHHPQFLPTRQGFDEFFGLPYSNDMWPHHPENKNYYPPLPLYENERVIDTLEEQHMLTTWYTERALDFIERNQDHPFFLYVAHSMPHVPLFVSDKFSGKSERGLYGDVIMEIDWSVGEILNALRKYGLDDRTLVIFASDNGPWLSYSGHSGEALPLREGKGTSWEGGIRVPCIMRWPEHIPAGKTQTEPAMTIDLLPTIARLTGGKLPEHPIDGLDIWPLIRMAEGATSPHEAFYIYYNRNELQAVLMGDWKLYLPHTYRTIKAGQGYRDDGTPIKYEMTKVETPELYHLATDISETTDVAGDHPEVVAKILGLAQQAREDLGDALTGVPGKNLRQPGRLDE
ncbi:arylsulfatase [Parapedobacter pyrenivorans]|uniref:Arylsulfatase n=1 Tax=Parapedobacter pyrenivorans TaxID=1305674 RepID=A0A917I0N7_9SPHI|nr:sulfatase [Parapedobacter pyrenivorans]GGG99454.1 arylsulfatase [Parapedobacter pyrenivorans]